MKKLILFLTLACMLWACSDSSSTGPEPTVEPFTEGQFDVEVSIPDHPVPDIFMDTTPS